MILWSGTLGVCCAWQNGSEHGVSGDINAFVDSALAIWLLFNQGWVTYQLVLAFILSYKVL
jgi:hypothetical protein